MKKDIHPTYRDVVFKDMGADYSFLTRSCVRTTQTVVWSDGQTYPLYTMEISSASHPFFTGKMKVLDAAGRVDRFQKKFGANYRGKPKA